MVSIKRVNINHKYFVVARADPKRKGLKGIIISRRRWGKSFRLEKARDIFKKNNTLFKNVKSIRLTNVREFSDFRKKPVRPKKKVQYFISVDFGKGKIITARSNQVDTDISTKTIKKQAESNLNRKISFEFENESDEDVGRRILDMRKPRIKQGFVYYARA